MKGIPGKSNLVTFLQANTTDKCYVIACKSTEIGYFSLLPLCVCVRIVVGLLPPNPMYGLQDQAYKSERKVTKYKASPTPSGCKA